MTSTVQSIIVIKTDLRRFGNRNWVKESYLKAGMTNCNLQSVSVSEIIHRLADRINHMDHMIWLI